MRVPQQVIPPQPGQPMVAASTVPIPDPTELTTQALLAAIANQKELFGTQLTELKGIVSRQQEQIAAVPGAIHEIVSAARELLEEKVLRLTEVTEEKLERVDSMFAERAAQASALAAANTKAIDTAFQSAEKAVAEQNKSSTTAINKSEASVADSLKQLQERFTTSITAANDKADANNNALGTQIADIKSRLDKGEGRTVGVSANVADNREVRRDSTNLWGVVAGAVLAGLGMLFVIIDKLSVHP